MQEKQQSLSLGTLIAERFEIRALLGAGGFGMTYQGWDRQLACNVAIKEYLPLEFASRAEGDTSVRAHGTRRDEYHYGLQRFLDEARTLARFKHPNVVRVVNFLEANGTAYLVMDFEEGESLSQYLRRHPGPVPEATLVAIAQAALRGLTAVHAQGFLHRDLKPGNIYLRRDGEALLIDFGAARQAIGQQSRSVTGIVSAGYAPTEQYGTDPKKQGPWTDLYGFGATLYRCISGKDPIDSPTRRDAVHDGEPDPLPCAQSLGAGRYGVALLGAIDACLRLPIRERPQTAQAVLEMLQAGPPVPPAGEGERADEPRSTVVTERVAAQDFREAAAKARSARAEPVGSPEASAAAQPAAGSVFIPAGSGTGQSASVVPTAPSAAARWRSAVAAVLFVAALGAAFIFVPGLRAVFGPDPAVTALILELDTFERGVNSPLQRLSDLERGYSGPGTDARDTERRGLAMRHVFRSGARDTIREALTLARTELDAGRISAARGRLTESGRVVDQLLALLKALDAAAESRSGFERAAADLERLAGSEKLDAVPLLKEARTLAATAHAALGEGRFDDAARGYANATRTVDQARNALLDELTRKYANFAERALQANLLKEAELALARAKELEGMKR